MDLSHDPHRGLGDLKAASEPLIGHRLVSIQDRLLRPEHNQSSNIGSPTEIHLRDDKSLANWWLLVLFSAPMIIVLLVFVLFLLHQRLKQLSHLFSTDSFRCHYGSQLRDKHCLLDDSSGTSASATSSISTSTTTSTTRASSPSGSSVCSSMDSMRSLVEHMNVYLTTFTYQEIISCLVVFMIAIMNVVRMRNLFCCNLVVFALVTSKLLNLFTMVLFGSTKLVRLCQLKPSHQQLSASRSDNGQEVQVNTIKGVSSAPKCPSGRSGNRSKRCSSPYDTNATICRLIVKDSSTSKQQTTNSSRVKPEVSSSRDKLEVWHKKRSSEPIAWRLLLLASVSSLLALVCLYLRLRLMPTFNGPVTLDVSSETKTNNKSSLDWSISIYAPTTSTEATTRYSSEPEQSKSQQPNYQASWSSKFQQSSQLKNLIDSYELQSFAHLLMDTQLQTSRFMCTLSVGHFAPLAKLSILVAYGAVMILVLTLSLAIHLVGHNWLLKFQSSSQAPPMLSCNGLGHKVGDSNKKRYSELLRQNIRHHQSSFDMDAETELELEGRTKPLASSSSMSSLLAPSSTLSCTGCKSGNCLNRHKQRSASQLGRLIGGQSMANLAHCHRTGKLAWLPLGSAATIASLSNIGREPEQDFRHKASDTRRGGCQQVCPRRLGPIGEQCQASLDERDELASETELDEGRSGRRARRQLEPTGGGKRSLSIPEVRSKRQCSVYLNQHYLSHHNYTDSSRRGNLNRVSYVELERDLRLAQWVLLFGQLLNHAPILFLLALASLLPDGLAGGWTSSHDNAFVWLSLIEALALPVLLCSLDNRLRLALRRSFKCNKSHLKLEPTRHEQEPPLYTAQLGPYTGARLANRLALAGALPRAGAQQRLVLGASASYPDFMFVCPASSSSPALDIMTKLGTPRASAGHSLTGPPYPARSLEPLNSNPPHRSIRANFALKDPTQASGSAPFGRSSYAELRPKRRRRHASALLSATRNLFRIRLKARSKRTSTAYSAATMSPDNNTASSKGETGAPERMSPTSSLSTLIRKFNHDNYTNVCQQYEQRKQQITNLNECSLKSSKAEVLIDGLDTSKCSAETKLIDEGEILCRKGGLYYEYSLEERSTGGRSRVNPLLVARPPQDWSSDRAKKKAPSSPIASSSEFMQVAHNEPGEQLPPSRVQIPEALSPTKLEPHKFSPSPADDKATEKSQFVNANNETIISNISSVQELLNKMNGIMSVQVEVGSSGKDSKQATSCVGKNLAVAQQHQLQRTKDTSSSKKQSKNCGSNQLKQYLHDGHYNNAYDTLDYASLRSMEDALSLVSASSEFEYHNIDQNIKLDCKLESSHQDEVSKEEQQQQQQQHKRPQQNRNVHSQSSIGVKHKPQLAHTTNELPNGEPPSDVPDVGSSSHWRHQTDETEVNSMASPITSMELKRLNDLRFPSFLPTTKSQSDEQATKQSHKQSGKRQPESLIIPSRVRQHESSAWADPGTPGGLSATGKSSSSLLNLTASKYAQQTHSGGRQLWTKSAVSSNTITKQRGSARVVTLSEFGSRSQLNKLAHNLPPEKGNVRARIRKMEQQQQQQQQSTPNLNSSHQQQEPSKERPHLGTSLIPVTIAAARIPAQAGVRLPKHGQHKWAQKDSDMEAQRKSEATRRAQ